MDHLFKTREEWFEEATRQFRGTFETNGLALPARLRLSCGLPSRKAFSEKGRILGQCWHAESASDGIHQIFISPTVEEGLNALGVLLHELVHACLPTDAKHGSVFKHAAHKLGLTEGPPKSAMPGKDLTKICEDVILLKLGKYPHSALNPQVAAGGPKADKCRMLKISCSHEHEEYVLRGSRKVIALGLPYCPVCGNQLQLPEGEGV